MSKTDSNKQTLDYHIKQVLNGKRRFETAFRSLARMVLEKENSIEEKVVNGKSVMDFTVFRQGKMHVVGMYDEIADFVSFIQDAADGGSTSEMAYVLVGEPGNGKTFFVEHLSRLYRDFIALPENNRFTFQFTDMNSVGKYGQLDTIESQTYEDPMVLAMNLLGEKDPKNIDFLRKAGYQDDDLERVFDNYRFLGACSNHILAEIREKYNGDIARIMKHIRVIPVPIAESSGVLTGKYPAKDKITASTEDLLGGEEITRLLHIADTTNPYRYNLRRGALARVAGGGIHFADELFKNKVDLINVYLGLIQNRKIEINGLKWPLDTVIIATSNNAEFARIAEGAEEAPIIDRCKVSWVTHNTDYKAQRELTAYAIGSKAKATFMRKPLHQDPNFNYALSVASVLTRLPRHEKLTPVEMMKLAAGETAGSKTLKTLSEVIDELNENFDISKRFGHTGLGQRVMTRVINGVKKKLETQKGSCIYAYDVFPVFNDIIRTIVPDENLRNKFLEDIDTAKGLYRERIEKEMFNAYMKNPEAIHASVQQYVNMIIGLSAESLKKDMWNYKDPQTGEMKSLKIDRKYIKAVENQMGVKTEEQAKTVRDNIIKIYGQKISVDPLYDFMDNSKLVKAVTNVRLKSDIGAAGSLVGALANRTNEENDKLYNEIMIQMISDKFGYCRTCATKTIEYFVTPDDKK